MLKMASIEKLVKMLQAVAILAQTKKFTYSGQTPQASTKDFYDRVLLTLRVLNKEKG